MSDAPAPQLNGLKSKNLDSCPFVGLKNDPETSFSYASKSNYCHKVQPPEPVSISYQESACLTAAYKRCPIYSPDWDGPLPVEIRRKVSKERHYARRFLLLFLLCLLIAGVAWLFLSDFGSTSVFAIFDPQDNVAGVSTQASYVVDSPTPSPQTVEASGEEPTATLGATNTPSLTITPSATYPVSTPGPFLKTPFGPYDGFVVHQVASGESVSLLASMYDTSNEVIVAVNGLDETYYFFGARTPRPTSDKPYLSPTPTFSEDAEPTKRPAFATATTETNGAKPTKTLTPTAYKTPDVWTTTLIYPGDVLVILPGQKDLEEVRQYRAVYVDKVVRVEDFARMYDLTVDELRYYNSLGAGDLIPADRWLVVPHQEGSPPPTPAPTLAATIDFSHAITPRFGPSGEYVLHMVRPGENISLIAERYHTTVQVLQAANGFTGLNPGDVLVVLPGRSDPEGVRMFETFLVSEDIAVEDLAAQMRVFESDLLWFNQLEEGSIVPAGQWVIYPKPVEEEK